MKAEVIYCVWLSKQKFIRASADPRCCHAVGSDTSVRAHKGRRARRDHSFHTLRQKSIRNSSRLGLWCC